MQGLQESSPREKGLCLRTMVNSQFLLHQKLVNDILRGAGETILEWLDGNSVTLGENESLRIRAAIMSISGDKIWFKPTNQGIKYIQYKNMLLINFLTGHKKLLHTFCMDGNYEMTDYMLNMTGIQDHTLDDGTTAFSMALARQDLKLIGLFLASKIPSDIDHKLLTQEALKEMDSVKCIPKLKDELTKGLIKNYGTQWSDENCPKEKPNICQE